MLRSIRIFQPNAETGILEAKFRVDAPEQIRGVDVLLERVAKLLHTEVGSNSYSPELGSLIGSKTASTVSDQMQAELMLHTGVKNIEALILKEQADIGTLLTPEQTLVSLHVSNIYQGAETTSWYIEVVVRTAANQAFFITA